MRHASFLTCVRAEGGEGGAGRSARFLAAPAPARDKESQSSNRDRTLTLRVTLAQ